MGTHTARLDALARLALGEASSEPAIAAKASALVRLVDAGGDSPVTAERLRFELQQVAETEALTARGLAAVLRALSALERLDAPAEFEWPSETPEVAAGPNHWPYCCSPAHHGQEAFRDVDASFGTEG